MTLPLPTPWMSPTSPIRRIVFSLLATILYVLLSLPTFAQENFMDGYIVKKNNDSLRGQVDYRDWGFNPVSIVFQDPRSGVKASFGNRLRQYLAVGTPAGIRCELLFRDRQERLTRPVAIGDMGQ